MFEQDLRFALTHDVRSTEASINGASVTGLFDEKKEDLFDVNGSSFRLIEHSFTCILSDLKTIGGIKNKSSLLIDGESYIVKDQVKDNKFVITLYLEKTL